MRTSSLAWRCGANFLVALVASSVYSSAVLPEDVVIRDAAGAAACLVTGLTDSSLTVLVRRPHPPAAELTATLPEELRDFSSRPISVLLLPSKADATGPSDAPRRPLRLNPAPIYPVVEGTLQPTPFITVQFNRSWLVAGTEIVAEQSAKAPTG